LETFGQVANIIPDSRDTNKDFVFLKKVILDQTYTIRLENLCPDKINRYFLLRDDRKNAFYKASPIISLNPRYLELKFLFINHLIEQGVQELNIFCDRERSIRNRLVQTVVDHFLDIRAQGNPLKPVVVLKSQMSINTINKNLLLRKSQQENKGLKRKSIFKNESGRFIKSHENNGDIAKGSLKKMMSEPKDMYIARDNEKNDLLMKNNISKNHNDNPEAFNERTAANSPEKQKKTIAKNREFTITVTDNDLDEHKAVEMKRLKSLTRDNGLAFTEDLLPIYVHKNDFRARPVIPKDPKHISLMGPLGLGLPFNNFTTKTYLFGNT
jgi:hypothetical protein